jgi:hypothetical protein
LHYKDQDFFVNAFAIFGVRALPIRSESTRKTTVTAPPAAPRVKQR